jgi:hypothetical protein
MIPILVIGFWAIFTYSAKLGLISEKYFDSFCNFVPFLLFGAIAWLIIELFIWILGTAIKEGNQDYFTCQICRKQFYKDYQVKKNICKDCYR